MRLWCLWRFGRPRLLAGERWSPGSEAFGSLAERPVGLLGPDKVQVVSVRKSIHCFGCLASAGYDVAVARRFEEKRRRKDRETMFPVKFVVQWVLPASSITLVSYLVDPASSHMLVSKIKPCMSKYKPH